MNHFEAAIWYARGVRISIPDEVLEFDEELTIDFEPGCKVSVRNEWGPEYDDWKIVDPERARGRLPFDWTPVLLLALVVFGFVMIWG